MTISALREALERNQIAIYFASMATALAIAWAWPASSSMEPLINPALALMLFVTFLQVPLTDLGKAFRDVRFLAALSFANFIAIPILVWTLVQYLPSDPMLLLGILFVLLCPCIDYVVTFAHLGRSDARSLLTATPLLLLVQMILLPVYLNLMVGHDAAALVKPEPFLHAFAILIIGPLILALATQALTRYNKTARHIGSILGLLPVPATALVLLIVIASVVPQLKGAIESVLRALPVYIAFAVTAPLIGWLSAQAFSLKCEQRRAIAFSSATRNSLVIMPLALAVPDSIPVIPAVIVTQTLVELVSELAYIQLLPKLDKGEPS